MCKRGESPHLNEVLVGHVCMHVKAAGDHLFWEQGVLGEEEDEVRD